MNRVQKRMRTISLYDFLSLQLIISIYISHIQMKNNIENQSKYQSYIIEQWYQHISSYTIPTSFINLSDEELRYISYIYPKIYNQYFLELNYLQKVSPQDSFLNPSKYWIYEEKLNQPLPQLNLPLIRDNLLSKIKAHMKDNIKYFAKLSLRSPKDSLSLRKNKQKRESLFKSSESSLDYSQIQRIAMMVEKPQDALQMLCSSQRIKDDIQRLIKNKNYSVNLVLREWTTIPYCLQFRVFMSQKKVTAISSYYKSQVHFWLIKHKKLLQESILNLLSPDTLKLIPYQSGVFDIGFQLQGKLSFTETQIQEKLIKKEFKPLIIQVNPFGKETGAALFSWQLNKQILFSGPLQFRLCGEQY